uniref:Peptidase S1 domain-containing protein n=1 Tax=Panagrolaimus sp. ES5 TaxID=591445 RepID=A0AC34FV87_9BILA
MNIFVKVSIIVIFSVFANADSDHIRKARMTYAEPTNIENYPYVAFGGHCTASIIHERYLLAAYHCYGSPNPSDLSFWVGVDDRNNISAGVQHFAEAIFRGSGGNVQLDISLIRLAQPITFGPRAQPVKLNGNLILEPNEIVTVAGFGLTEHGGYSQELRHGNFTFSSYWNISGNSVLTIKSPKNGLATGDSGSPAVVYRHDTSQCGPPERYQIGIAASAGTHSENGTTYYIANFSTVSSSPYVCEWLKEKSNNEIVC